MTADALQPLSFATDFSLKEEYTPLEIPSMSSAPSEILPPEKMIRPAFPQRQSLEIVAPVSSHSGNIDVVRDVAVHVPRFRSGTLSIELPSHVRPFDWKYFPPMRPQAQQVIVHPEDRVAPASSAPPSDPSLLPTPLAQPGSSVLADHFDPADEREDTGAARQPIDLTPKLFRCAQRVQMRRDIHDKPRRLLALSSGGFLSVTMRGSLGLVEQDTFRYTPLRTSMGDSSRQLVEDACVLHDAHKRTVVIGRAGNNEQLSLVRIQDGNVPSPFFLRLNYVLTPCWKAHDIGFFDRRSPADKKGGISAVCTMMQSAAFATGGYDHLVNLWSLSNEGGSPPVPSAPLAIKHKSAIHSLLPVRDTSHKLLTGGADCTLAIYDLSSERTINTLKLSNSIYHVHSAVSPFCTLLEVRLLPIFVEFRLIGFWRQLAHREFQFEVRDYRLVPEASAVRFGYPNAKVHGRHTRGSSIFELVHL